MKYSIPVLLIIFLWSCGSKPSSDDHSHHAQPAATDAKPKSPKKMAMTNVGNNHVHIEYSSPSKRGRQIFGGLVAFGEVWVTGAHKATSISFSENALINGVEIEKGKYALFTIPGEEEWIVIINRNWDQHLADEYDQAEDIIRFSVTPNVLEESVEALTYSITETAESTGEINISWDKINLSFEVKDI